MQVKYMQAYEIWHECSKRFTFTDKDFPSNYELVERLFITRAKKYLRIDAKPASDLCYYFWMKRAFSVRLMSEG